MPPVVAAIISGASTLGAAGIGAHASNNAAKMSNNATMAQMQLAQDQLTRSRPAYDQAFNYYSNLLKGDPESTMRAIGPNVDATNLFFQNAQRNLIQGSAGRGGGLTAGLANLEGNRAASLSQLLGTAQSGAASGLSGLATGSTTAALQALASASQGQFNQQLLQQQAYGGIGSFVTRLLSNPSFFSMFQRSPGPNFSAEAMNGVGDLPVGAPNISFPQLPALIPSTTSATPLPYGGRS